MRQFAASSLALCILAGSTLTACGGGGGGGGSSGPPPSRPDVFYVRASGDDANDGSKDAPFRTIPKAVGLISDGDTIIVGPGTYTDFVDINKKKGLVNSQIVIVGDPTGGMTGDAPGAVEIQVTDKEVAAIRLSQSTYVIIDGFTFTGARGTNAAGVIIRSASNNVTIRNCEITGNIDGIRVQDSDDLLLFNNLIDGNTRYGTKIGATSTGPGSQRARLINNTIANNGFTGIAIGDDNAASKDAFLTNNIVQGNEPRNIDVAGNAPSSVDGYSADFNLVFSAAASGNPACTSDAALSRCGYGPFTPRGTNDVNDDALFSDSTNGDFHLQENSPAIDAGTSDFPDADTLSSMLTDRTVTGRGTDKSPLDLGYHFPGQ